MAHKTYSLIINAINQGKLIEPFDQDDFRKACPGLSESTYRSFLNKHRKGNPSETSELFEKITQVKYKLIRPFKYGFIETDNSENNKKKEEAYFKEHEELVHLFNHEDTVGWNLLNFYIIMNFALVSSIGLLLTQESLEKLISVIITLCGMGVFISSAWFFIYGRVRLHHRMHLFRLYKIEKELQIMGYPLDTLKSTFQKSHRGKTPFKDMKYLDPEGKEQKMRFYELIEALKLVHYIMVIVAFSWLYVALRFANII